MAASDPMTENMRRAELTPKLVDSLYTEAMVLADEARSYFDINDDAGRLELDPLTRVGFACESLKVTTRIMHIIAWLLTQRAVESGELPAGHNGRRPERRLGHAGDSDPEVVQQLPPGAQRLVSASTDLYARVKRLDEDSLAEVAPSSPARARMGRLERDVIWNQPR